MFRNKLTTHQFIPPAMRSNIPSAAPTEWYGGMAWHRNRAEVIKKNFYRINSVWLAKGVKKERSQGEREPSWGSYKKHKTRAYRLCNNHSFRNCRKINCKTNGFPYSLHICIYSFFRVQQVVCGVCTSIQHHHRWRRQTTQSNETGEHWQGREPKKYVGSVLVLWCVIKITLHVGAHDHFVVGIAVCRLLE